MISNNDNYLNDLKRIISAARTYGYRAVNQMQIISNWLVGWRLVEQEQQGKQRADYGKHIIEEASKALTEEFGKGYSEASLRSYRLFYLEYKGLPILEEMPSKLKESFLQIQQTLSAELPTNEKQQTLPAESDASKGQALLAQLSWSHYERLMRVPDLVARNWYMREAATQQWDYRTLKRNIDSQYYYRIVQTPEPLRKDVENEMLQLTSDYEKEKSVFVKNPLLVEFLGLSADTSFTETHLEGLILTHIQKFLMGMGKGYAFVARQQHIHTSDDDYYIDLVFYNYILGW